MVFEREYLATARLAFGMWNRDPASPSYGSFDRAWWGWKFKDFSDATLQYAARIAVPYAERQPGAPIGEWLDAWVRFMASIQYRDGSLDQAYPYERTPGVILDVLSTLIDVHESSHLSADGRRRLKSVIERAAGFALKSDERHGEIANHLAQYAYELANYARFSSDPRASSEAGRYLDRLLAVFDRDEGWFREYEGPDPGYQTRTLRYVVKLASLPGYEQLWDVAARAGDFLEQFVMPDGSVHPMLGARSTALVYPSGIEALASRDAARFGPLAARVRRAWDQRLVPLPSTLDFGNAIRLADDAREAAAQLANIPDAPHQPAKGHRVYARAGLSVWHTAARSVYLAQGLGGVVVTYEKGQLAHEDSGYLFENSSGAWVTRMAAADSAMTEENGRLIVRARFARVLHDELTPARLLILRILNLTLLRSQWIGDLFRQYVVGRLMVNRSWLNLTLTRTVAVDDRALRLDDTVESDRHLEGALWRCRRLTGAHMASARYFQEQELHAIGVWRAEVAWNGRRAVHTLVKE